MPDDIPETVATVTETPTLAPPDLSSVEPEPVPVPTETQPESVAGTTATADDAIPDEPEAVVAATEDDATPDEPVPVPEETPTVPAVAETTPETPAETPAEPSKKKWYIVKVQSNREDSIKEAIERQVRIKGLEEYFGQIIIPVERVQELRRGKRVTKSIKLYPGYLMVEVEFNESILYLFRETSGVGDFVGHTLGKPPTPMSDKEIARMLHQTEKPPVNLDEDSEKPDLKTPEKKPTAIPKFKPKFAVGDRIRVTDGNFAGMEGEVVEMSEERVKVIVSILGRPVALDLEFWQVETL